jgi:uncharacterized protein YdaU (DUF1376 family)
MHYYPFHLKDYLVETAHLPPMADLAYRRLLDLYYKTESPIRNEPKWVANRIRLDGEERVIGFVLREYFILDKDADPPVWRHKTCDEVIAKYQKKAAVARANGEKHVAGTNREPKSDADRKLTKNHKPRTKNTPLPPEGELAWESFWTAYPFKVGKPKAKVLYAKALAAGVTPETILAGLKRHIGCAQWADQTKIPHPTTWLTREGWNDDVAVPPGPAGDEPKAWWSGRSGIIQKGLEFGLPAPPPADQDPDNQQWFRFQASVWFKAGEGPWIEPGSRSHPLYRKLRDGGV